MTIYQVEAAVLVGALVIVYWLYARRATNEERTRAQIMVVGAATAATMIVLAFVSPLREWFTVLLATALGGGASIVCFYFVVYLVFDRASRRSYRRFAAGRFPEEVTSEVLDPPEIEGYVAALTRHGFVRLRGTTRPTDGMITLILHRESDG